MTVTPPTDGVKRTDARFPFLPKPDPVLSWYRLTKPDTNKKLPPRPPPEPRAPVVPKTAAPREEDVVGEIMIGIRASDLSSQTQPSTSCKEKTPPSGRAEKGAAPDAGFTLPATTYKKARKETLDEMTGKLVDEIDQTLREFGTHAPKIKK